MVLIMNCLYPLRCVSSQQNISLVAGRPIPTFFRGSNLLKTTIACLFLMLSVSLYSFSATAQGTDTKQATNQAEDQSELAEEIESLRQAMVALNRDLFILEEDLLFPSSTQVAVYLAMDIGEYFALDSVELKINGEVVTTYLYTERQVSALYRGGVQRLYLGNVAQGEHTLTAFLIGIGPENREYKRGVSIDFSKTDEPVAIELEVIDSTTKQQPIFNAQVL